MKVFLNLLGIVVVIGLIFLISWDRKNIRWKAVGKAIIAQFVIAILLVSSLQKCYCRRQSLYSLSQT